jgi:hypothetical protein
VGAGGGAVSTTVVFGGELEVAEGDEAELDGETGEGLKLSKAELLVAAGSLSLAAGIGEGVAEAVDLRPRL